jgi:hypothetical protein
MKTIIIKKISKINSIILICAIGLFCMGYKILIPSKTTSIKENEITISDGKTWGKDNITEILEMWSGVLPISENSIEIESPITLKIIEHKESGGQYDFDKFKSICFNYLIDLSYPYTYEKQGIKGAESYYGCPCEDLKISGRTIFNKSPQARKDLIDFAINCYNKVETSFPNSWKKYYLNKMDKLISFTKNYSQNRNSYLKIANKETDIYNPNYNPSNQLLYNIGLLESFVYRRIEHDKVPPQEIINYLTLLKTNLTKSIKEGSSNYCNLSVNSKDIIISDISLDYLTGLKVKIWKPNSTKEVIIEGFYGIKYLKNNSKNYYLIYHKKFIKNQNVFEEKSTLIDNNLNIIPS